MTETLRVGLERDTAMYLTAVFIIMLCVLFLGTEALMALAATIALLVIVPAAQLRRMLGYLLAVDLTFSVWLLHTASATLGGFQIAVLAGLFYSVFSREILRAWGSEKLAVNGKTKMGEQVAELFTYGIAWVKAVWAGRSGPVVAPEPLRWEWVEHKPAGGFAATQLGKLWAMLF